MSGRKVRAAIERVSLNRLLEIAVSTYLGDRPAVPAPGSLMRRVAEE